jgi:dihydrodipicolinate synthase/N-acetylneuraminate lyase
MKQWQGVFPATTTQFGRDESLDVGATQKVVNALIEDGVDGIICMGTVGENCSLTAQEKRTVLAAVKEVTAGRVPVISGVAEYTTALASQFAKDAEAAGIDGLMVLPAMVYKSNRRETIAHFRAVAAATTLPIMIYNNPISYGVDVTVDMWADLADVRNIVAIKESSEDTRRIVDVQREYGDRFTLFAGVDDIVLESLMLGAQGWVSGLTNAFPRESVALFALAKAGRYAAVAPRHRSDARPVHQACRAASRTRLGNGSGAAASPRRRRACARRARGEGSARQPAQAAHGSRPLEVILDARCRRFHRRAGARTPCRSREWSGADHLHSAPLAHRESRAAHARSRYSCTGPAAR